MKLVFLTQVKELGLHTPSSDPKKEIPFAVIKIPDVRFPTLGNRDDIHIAGESLCINDVFKVTIEKVEPETSS